MELGEPSARLGGKERMYPLGGDPDAARTVDDMHPITLSPDIPPYVYLAPRFESPRKLDRHLGTCLGRILIKQTTCVATDPVCATEGPETPPHG